MAEFVVFGKQSVNTANVIRGEWDVAQGGRSVLLKLFMSDGYQLSCPYDDPQSKRIADLLGFAELHAGWPKQKAAADARFKAEQDQKEAAKKQFLQQRQRGLVG